MYGINFDHIMKCVRRDYLRGQWSRPFDLRQCQQTSASADEQTTDESTLHAIILVRLIRAGLQPAAEQHRPRMARSRLPLVRGSIRSGQQRLGWRLVSQLPA